jgi:hypothetical protein
MDSDGAGHEDAVGGPVVPDHVLRSLCGTSRRLPGILALSCHVVSTSSATFCRREAIALFAFSYNECLLGRDRITSKNCAYRACSPLASGWKTRLDFPFPQFYF